MVKEEILEGLKVALKKGESLRAAMMSFYNAGYSKEEIEEAAALITITKATQSPSTTQQSTTTLQSALSKQKVQSVSSKKILQTAKLALPTYSTPFKQVTQPKTSFPQKIQVIVPASPTSSSQVDSTSQTASTTSQDNSPTRISYRPQEKVKLLKQKPQRIIQRVSEYEDAPSTLGTAVTIILVSLLLILLGLLAVIFLFKDEILVLLNNLFGI